MSATLTETNPGTPYVISMPIGGANKEVTYQTFID
jgi:hypothetical protein